MAKLFYLIFCTTILMSAFFVVLVKNPVESVLFLIFSFFNAGAILFFFNLEFYSVLFLIIYVGAIAILFLFIVMMLNVKLQYEYNAFNNLMGYFLFAIIVYLILFVVFFKFFDENYVMLFNVKNFAINNLFNIEILQNYLNSLNSEEFNGLEVIGQTLFNNSYVYLPIIGFILLAPLIGVIILTLPFNKIKKLQLSHKQLSRTDNFLSFFKSELKQ